MLLCAENLDIHNKYIDQNNDLDTLSVASSNHFTIVNGMGNYNRHKSNKPIQCCCKHQLTVLVISMTIVIFLTIVYCVYYVHSKFFKFKMFNILHMKQQILLITTIKLN